MAYFRNFFGRGRKSPGAPAPAPSVSFAWGTAAKTVSDAATEPDPQFSDVTTGSGTTAGSGFTATLPTGWAIDDFAVLVVVFDAGVTTTASAGWTESVADFDDGAPDSSLRVYTRRLQSGDSAPTITPSADGNYCFVHAVYSATTDGSEIYGTPVTVAPAATTTPQITGISVLDDQRVVLVIGSDPAGSSGDFTEPTNTNLRDQVRLSASRIAALADISESAGSKSYTWTAPESDSYALAALVLSGAGTGATEALTPTDPAGITTDDLRIVYAYCGNPDSTIGTPAGYTEVVNDSTGAGGTLMVAVKTYAADSAPEVTFGSLTNGDACIVGVGYARGVGALDQTGTVAHNASAQNVGPVGGITPSEANTGIIFIGAKADNYTSSDLLTSDVTWERGTGHSQDATVGASVFVQYAVDGGTTTVGNQTLTVTGGASAPGMGVIFNIAPGATTPPPVQTYYRLDVSLAGDGTGNVTSQGINCPAGGEGGCDEVYPAGEVVQLYAVPATNSEFTSWGGDASGSSTPTTVTMDSAKSVTATFTDVTPEPGGDLFAGLTPRAWAPTTVSDWQKLVDNSNGDFTNGSGYIQASAPAGGTTQQQRVEVQAYKQTDGGSTVPGVMGYRWEMMLPTGSVIPTGVRASGYLSVNQFRTDQSCYTGGVDIHEDGYLGMHIKGGATSSFSSSCVQAYDVTHPFTGALSYNTWYKIEILADWQYSNGSMVVWVDGVEALNVTGVPTIGLGLNGSMSGAATAQKFRLGIYGRVYPGTFTVRYRNVKVYE